MYQHNSQKYFSAIMLFQVISKEKLMKTLKITLATIAIIFLIVAGAGMYKFNYLANQSGYDVDGNKIENTWVERYIKDNQLSEAKVEYTIEKVNLSEQAETYFIHIEGKDWCGTGGCPLLIVAKNKHNVKLINEFIPIQDIIIQNETVNDWKVLTIVIGDGGSNETRKYSYNNKNNQYQVME